MKSGLEFGAQCSSAVENRENQAVTQKKKRIQTLS